MLELPPKESVTSLRKSIYRNPESVGHGYVHSSSDGETIVEINDLNNEQRFHLLVRGSKVFIPGEIVWIVVARRKNNPLHFLARLLNETCLVAIERPEDFLSGDDLWKDLLLNPVNRTSPHGKKFFETFLKVKRRT